MKNMGDSTSNKSGLVFRTAKFFNNESLSDMQIVVKGETRFYVHKLILAMASKRFAALLSGKNETNGSLEMPIVDFSPKIVHLILQYLYTDELYLTNIIEAMDVLRLASKFEIQEIIDKCKNYIGLDRITADNVFSIYDLALRENLGDLLMDCRYFFCNKAPFLLNSIQFCEATLEVLKDILNLNSLVVEKEIDIINAVLRWCKRDCERKELTTEPICIRDSISPLLPHLRFLTLSVDEFCEFVAQHGIFTSPESVLLTRKIIDPKSDCKVPTGFCSNFRPRRNVSDMVLKPDTVKATPPRISANVPETRIGTNVFETRSAVVPETRNANVPETRVSANVPETRMSANVPETRMSANVPETRMSSNVPETRMSSNVPETKMNVPEKRMSLKVVRSPVNSEPLRAPRRPQQNISLSPELNKQPVTPTYSFPQSGMRNESLTSKSLFTFSSETRKFPMLKMVPSTPVSTKKVFDFPLQAMQKELFSVSKRDLICSAEIRVSKGRMVIFGIELKIMSLKHNPEESIQVSLSISGDCDELDSSSSVRLNNSVIALTLAEPLTLNLNSSAKIEVTIEDLKLNRCSVCKQVTHELNSGLNLATVITLNSNQNNEGDGFFFLISRIIYI